MQIMNVITHITRVSLF